MLRSDATGSRVSSVLILSLIALAGCSGSDGNLEVSGVATFDGVPVPGEITFELLDHELAATGRAVSAYPSSTGEFSVSIPRPAGGSAGSSTGDEYPCRITLRLAPPTGSGLPVAFDYDVPPEKVVTLQRVVTSDSQFHFAVTQ